MDICSKDSFVSLVVLDGEFTLKWDNDEITAQKGDSIFIPAGYGSFTVSGSCLIIKTRID
jgi:mannose-6-phosphate isomerase